MHLKLYHIVYINQQLINMFADMMFDLDEMIYHMEESSAFKNNK